MRMPWPKRRLAMKKMALFVLRASGASDVDEKPPEITGTVECRINRPDVFHDGTIEPPDIRKTLAPVNLDCPFGRRLRHHKKIAVPFKNQRIGEVTISLEHFDR